MVWDPLRGKRPTIWNQGGSLLARTDTEGQVGGGGYDNFEFTVTDAWFGPSEAFTAKTQINAIFLHWVGTTTLDGVPTLDAEDSILPT